jgi:ATP adenylyltransferase
MERLWSPWRLKYIEGAAASQCVFCEAAAASAAVPGPPDTAPRTDEVLVVTRGALAFVILNLYPYNNGHLMVVPNRHIASLAAASGEELDEIMRLVRDSEIALHEAYQPQGINVGINLGRAAGAGIADHLHVHLVPRWSGDSNFMSVVGETRVLPETLDQTAARLKPVFHRLRGARA